MKRQLLSLLPLAILAACSAAEHGHAPAKEAAAVTHDTAAAPVAPKVTAVDSKEEGGTAGQAAAGVLPPSAPRIAYIYDYGYRVTADRIAELQRKHADLCEKQGPNICRILEMRQSGAEGDYASGTLLMAVAAPRARAFGAELGKLAGDTGGQEVSSGITGEDLSKQIVDTEARLRARTALRDRLMEVLQTRKGTVAELVEAERGVAQVNEEIDQARSWLTEMQGRVDFSRVNLNYSSGSPAGGGFMEPIRGALGSIGMILGLVIAAIIVIATITLPLGLIGWGLRSAWRRLRPARAEPEPVPPSP
jgi:hypothetical protein